MKTKKLRNNIIKIALPLLLGSAILYWMYRGFDFSSIKHVLFHEMNWTWMILSLPFGILAQAFRGWRWKQTLEPIGEHPRSSVCVNAIFLSYAVSLLIPRIGEFARCGVLNRYDNGCDWKSRWYDHRNAHHSNCIPDANRSLCELLFKDRNPYWRHIPNVFNNRMDCNWNMRDSFSYSFLFCSASSFHI